MVVTSRNTCCTAGSAALKNRTIRSKVGGGGIFAASKNNARARQSFVRMTGVPLWVATGGATNDTEKS